MSSNLLDALYTLCCATIPSKFHKGRSSRLMISVDEQVLFNGSLFYCNLKSDSSLFISDDWPLP